MRRVWTVTPILALLALALSGCRVFVAEDPLTHVRVTAFSLLTSPKIGHATVTVQTATTRETFDLENYDSPSNVTGADIATIAAAVVKAMTLGVP